MFLQQPLSQNNHCKVSTLVANIKSMFLICLPFSPATKRAPDSAGLPHAGRHKPLAQCLLTPLCATGQTTP